MNLIGKILVVFVATASMGFLAFVGAMRYGGPDWKSELRAPEMQREFTFSTEPGEVVTYSAKHRRTETSIAEKSRVQAEVILKARKRLEDDANKKLQSLAAEPQKFQEGIKFNNDSIAVDRKGVEQREQYFENRFAKLWSDIQSVDDEFSAATIQTQEVLAVVQERREESYRLANQLELLRNDRYSAEEQQKVLADELKRLEENRQRLERRQKQLKEQLGDS